MEQIIFLAERNRFVSAHVCILSHTTYIRQQQLTQLLPSDMLREMKANNLLNCFN